MRVVLGLIAMAALITLIGLGNGPASIPWYCP